MPRYLKRSNNKSLKKPFENVPDKYLMIVETLGISYLVNRYYGGVKHKKAGELALVVALAMAVNEMVLEKMTAPTSTGTPNVANEQSL